jgi:hypothetical protein
VFRSCRLLRSLEYAAYDATLQEKQKRNEVVSIPSVERGTRFCRHVRSQEQVEHRMYDEYRLISVDGYRQIVVDCCNSCNGVSLCRHRLVYFVLSSEIRSRQKFKFRIQICNVACSNALRHRLNPNARLTLSLPIIII